LDFVAPLEYTGAATNKKPAGAGPGAGSESFRANRTSREGLMKAYLVPFLLLLAGPALAQQSVPEIAFDSVKDYPSLPPGMNFGEVPGVAVNSKGHVFVFTRSNSAGGPAYAPTAAQLLEFTADGAYVGEIGKGLYAWSFAHSVRIDKDDNIWAIDKGSDMIVKFNPAGRVVWVFGRRKESADEDTKPWEHVEPPLAHVDGMFRQPTDVAWDSAGNIYITDGYINSRVAKYDKNGDWVKSWGSKGTGPGQFRTPHAIAIDRNDNVYVGDRANRRIQVFDTDGNFKRMFTIDVWQYADRRAPRPGDRGAQFDLHHPRRQPGDVRRGIHLPRTHLQGLARRQGARRHRPLGSPAQAVLRRPRARLSVRKRGLRGGDRELAGAEADSALAGERRAHPPC
jgi:6-bladed beta-propeller